MYNLVYHHNYAKTLNQQTSFSLLANSELNAYLNTFYRFECLPTISLLLRPIYYTQVWPFFIKDFPIIKILFQIKSQSIKPNLLIIPIKEWNVLVFRRVSWVYWWVLPWEHFLASGVATASYSSCNTCWSCSRSFRNIFSKNKSLLKEVLLPKKANLK